MTYFRKIFVVPLLKNLWGRLSKGHAGEKNVSVLVQDSLPIDVTIAKC
jgi:hypothetical protein